MPTPAPSPAYDPDEEAPPVYDERAVFAVPPRVIDPIRQKRGRNARLRGHSVEREWFRIIGDASIVLPVTDQPERRGTSGTEDGRWLDYSFEIKSHERRWSQPGELVKAWEQARNRCGYRTPVVVESYRSGRGVVALWRVWPTPAAWIEGKAWVSDQVIARLSR